MSCFNFCEGARARFMRIRIYRYLVRTDWRFFDGNAGASAVGVYGAVHGCVCGSGKEGKGLGDLY